MWKGRFKRFNFALVRVLWVVGKQAEQKDANLAINLHHHKNHDDDDDEAAGIPSKSIPFDLSFGHAVGEKIASHGLFSYFCDIKKSDYNTG